MDFEEYAAVYASYVEQRDIDFKNDWQRIRMLASIMIQPHLSKNKKLTPEKLLPFPWDKPLKSKNKEKKSRQLTPDQQRERMAEIVKKLGDTM